MIRCGSEDHMISKYPKPPKDNEKRRRQVRFNEKGNRACDNGKNNDDHKIYAPMTRMSSNDKRSSENYGDSSQLTNWILDSGATCHMTPEISDIIPGSLEDTDKYIEMWTDIMSRQNKEVKYKYKYATITERLSLHHYTTYFWIQTYATGYFQSLR